MDNALIGKLRLAAGQRVLVLNAPEGYRERLEEMAVAADPAGATAGAFDFVQLFVRSQAELERQGPIAYRAVRYDGLLWVCYPKKSGGVESDLSRDLVAEVVSAAGLRPVTQVAIDAVWSALRFRPPEQVGR